MLRMFIMATILLTGMVVADEPPPVPDGGLMHMYTTICIDNETGEEGVCYLMMDVTGNLYTTFYQKGVLMFIRRATDDGYEVVWVNDIYMGI